MESGVNSLGILELETYDVSRKTKLAMNSSTCLRPLLARPEAAAMWLALTAVPMLALPQAARAQDTGITDLGGLGGWSAANGVSGDGSVVVGVAYDST